MATKLITILPILCLESARRCENLGRLLIRQAQRVKRIPEKILVAIAEHAVHVGIGDHVICEVEHS